MKQFITFAKLFLVLMLLLGAPRIVSGSPAPQANNTTHSRSGRATAHNRPARKHHASNQHHRHRTTAKRRNS